MSRNDPSGVLTPARLKAEVAAGRIDTVLVAIPDMFGRLMGKRMTGRTFVDQVLKEGTHACSYLLTVNLDMDPLDGFAVANWDKGFGDFCMVPDAKAVRVLPWHEKTVLALCDFRHHNGQDVAESPRAVLKAQVDRLAKLGLTAKMASELEFHMYNQTFHEAFAGGYRNIITSSDYRIDYHLLQPGRDEPILGSLRRLLPLAGIPVECSKGEWSRGQHEINLDYADPVEMADRHTVFKHAVKEVAASHGKCVTFMAKPSMTEAGSSCHVHVSIWKGGKNILDSGKGKEAEFFGHFLGGLMKYAPEMSLLYAPTVNSYKRYQPGSWAPTKIAWATDNRTTGFRVVGHGGSFRIENRMPGADANAYLAFAATLAAGVAGVEEGLDCGNAYAGNAYIDESLPAIPHSLSDATDLFEKSALARKAFSSPVVDFYVRHARLEAASVDAAISEWDLLRYFERI